MASTSMGPGSPGDKPDRAKPRLWAEGRQRPGFDARALLRVSLSNSRSVAAPVLVAMAARLDRFGTRVEDGVIRIPAARLGRSGRFLPSHITTGRRLRDAAALTRLAADAARGDVPVDPMPFRGWTDAPGLAVPPMPAVAERAPEVAARVAPAERLPVQRPKRPAPLAPAPTNAEGDRDTLDVIRNLMSMTVVEPVHPMRGDRATPAPPPHPTGAGALPELAPAEPSPRSALFKLTGRVLGSLSVGLAFPVGLMQAGYAMARGEDLRLAP